MEPALILLSRFFFIYSADIYYDRSLAALFFYYFFLHIGAFAGTPGR
jgi:hypothetical protein